MLWEVSVQLEENRSGTCVGVEKVKRKHVNAITRINLHSANATLSYSRGKPLRGSCQKRATKNMGVFFSILKIEIELALEHLSLITKLTNSANEVLEVNILILVRENPA